MDEGPVLRRTRFVCISDTHNCTVKLPKGDVLIHAGDLTNQGSYSELSKAVQWLEKADFEAKLIVAGNHDITLDRDFYAEHGLYFHNQLPQDPEKCLSLLTSSPTITYLCHSSTTVRLRNSSGPQTVFTVFGSPYSPRHGLWAFGYERSSLDPSRSRSQSRLEQRPRSPTSEEPAAPSPTAESLWSQIPLDTDVLITHTPPYRHVDESPTIRRALGCEALRRALWRVRPRLAVCGHVHEGRGAERVCWDIEGRGGANVAYAEAGVQRWEDPGEGNGKISLVNLTTRGGGSALENDGSCPALYVESCGTEESLGNAHDEGRGGCCGLGCGLGQEPQPRVLRGRQGMEEASQDAGIGDGDGSGGGGGQERGTATADQAAVLPGIGTRGLGGDSASSRCDREALLGRMGRRETCVVNCAVVAKGYPHTGGRLLNKPVVVDLDLPVWDYSG